MKQITVRCVAKVDHGLGNTFVRFADVVFNHEFEVAVDNGEADRYVVDQVYSLAFTEQA